MAHSFFRFHSLQCHIVTLNWWNSVKLTQLMQQTNKGNKQRIIIIVIVMIIRAELLYQDISCCRPPLYPVSTSNSDILMREQPHHHQIEKNYRIREIYIYITIFENTSRHFPIQMIRQIVVWWGCLCYPIWEVQLTKTDRYGFQKRLNMNNNIWEINLFKLFFSSSWSADRYCSVRIEVACLSPSSVQYWVMTQPHMLYFLTFLIAWSTSSQVPSAQSDKYSFRKQRNMV